MLAASETTDREHVKLVSFLNSSDGWHDSLSLSLSRVSWIGFYLHSGIPESSQSVVLPLFLPGLPHRRRQPCLIIGSDGKGTKWVRERETECEGMDLKSAPVLLLFGSPLELQKKKLLQHQHHRPEKMIIIIMKRRRTEHCATITIMLLLLSLILFTILAHVSFSLSDS